MTARPRVAIVYRMTEPGGVQSCVLSLIRGLNRKGIEPDLLWDLPPSPSLLARARANANYRPMPLAVPSRLIDQMPDSLRYLAWIANVVDGERFGGDYDAIYSFFNGFLMPEGVPHLYYLSGPPLLPQLETFGAGLRGVPARAFRWVYKEFLRRRHPVYEYHRNCNYVINSLYTARLFQEAHGVALPVVYPPIDLSGRAFGEDDLKQRDSLLFFSRIVAEKRPELVLELAERHPGLRCVVMGGVPPHRRSYLEGLKRRARERGVAAVFHANPTEETVRQELARAKYYVFPAVGEHFGMTTPEAIASGAIPFVHDSGGQREIVPDARLRFSDEDRHAKFEELLQLPERELREVRARLLLHVNQFTEDAFLDRILPYLEKAA